MEDIATFTIVMNGIVAPEQLSSQDGMDILNKGSLNPEAANVFCT